MADNTIYYALGGAVLGEAVNFAGSYLDYNAATTAGKSLDDWKNDTTNNPIWKRWGFLLPGIVGALGILGALFWKTKSEYRIGLAAVGGASLGKALGYLANEYMIADATKSPQRLGFAMRPSYAPARHPVTSQDELVTQQLTRYR